MKVGFVSLGCAKNLVDSEAMIGRLVAAGHAVVEDVAECDCVVVNTCAFIDEAKRESIDQVLEFEAIRKAGGRLRRIVVAGCLAERYLATIGKLLPEVDAVVPLAGREAIVEAVTGKPAPAAAAKAEPVRLTPTPWAYLRISDGCDNRCSYCVIPDIRGPLVSVPMKVLVDRARRLVESGAREINVIAQDSANYGRDLYGRPRLAELIGRLSAVDGVEWLRVLYLHPDHLDDRLLDALALPNVARYLDLPMQHVVPRLLTKMNRRGACGGRKPGAPSPLADAAGEVYLRLLERVRARLPGITVRSAFIVGFPGETDRDAAAVCDFLAAARMDRVAFFRYSREEGTPAAKLRPQVDEPTKVGRINALIRTQNKVVAAINRDLRGKVFRAMVERADADTGEAWFRTEREAPEVDGLVSCVMRDGPLAPGDFRAIRITGSHRFELYGELA